MKVGKLLTIMFGTPSSSCSLGTKKFEPTSVPCVSSLTYCCHPGTKNLVTSNSRMWVILGANTVTRGLICCVHYYIWSGLSGCLWDGSLGWGHKLFLKTNITNSNWNHIEGVFHWLEFIVLSTPGTQGRSKNWWNWQNWEKSFLG